MALLNEPNQVPDEGDTVVSVEVKRDGPNDPYGAAWVTFASGKKIWFSLTYRDPNEESVASSYCGSDGDGEG